MAKFCLNCGKALKENAKFCSNCGTKVPVKPATQSSNNYEDMIAAGAGMLAGAAIVTADNSAYAQPTNIPPMAAPPPAGDVNNFFGFASNSLQEMTGSVDVTNIVAHVAQSFGVEDVAEYADIMSAGANELIDAAADVAGEATGDIIGTLFDIFTS